jgi:hypothetical protein
MSLPSAPPDLYATVHTRAPTVPSALRAEFIAVTKSSVSVMCGRNTPRVT